MVAWNRVGRLASDPGWQDGLEAGSTRLALGRFEEGCKRLLCSEIERHELEQGPITGGRIGPPALPGMQDGQAAQGQRILGIAAKGALEHTPGGAKLIEGEVALPQNHPTAQAFSLPRQAPPDDLNRLQEAAAITQRST